MKKLEVLMDTVIRDCEVYLEQITTIEQSIAHSYTCVIQADGTEVTLRFTNKKVVADILKHIGLFEIEEFLNYLKIRYNYTVQEVVSSRDSGPIRAE